MDMDTERTENELADFAHARAPYDTHWMDDRIKLFLGRNIVIPHRELPAVTHSASNGLVTALAQQRCQPALKLADGELNDGGWSRKIAYANLAVAMAIEGQAAAVKERAVRRDELAAEFTAVNSYSGQLPYTQNLINRIIELEDAAK